MADALTVLASHAGADDVVHDKSAGNVFQLIDCISSKLAQRATAVGASIAERKDLLDTWQMVRQWVALRLSLCIVIGFRRPYERCDGRFCYLIVLKAQLRLVDSFSL